MWSYDVGVSPKKADTGPSMPGAIWFRERPPTRVRGSLDRDRIARAAVALLDEGGTAALTLRALADRLGVHVTSLYWHVSTRDDLLDLAVDAVFGELAEPAEPAEPVADWTVVVVGFMADLRDALLRHPWSAALAASRPLLGPQALHRSEAVYTALARAGFTGAALTAAAAAVSNLVIGNVTAQTSLQGAGEDATRQAMHHHLRAHADRYPTLAALPGTTAGAWTDQFQRAADALLRGLAAQLDDLA